MPQLLDPNFHRTVVLLLEHRVDDGTLGVVLNRDADMSLAEVYKSLGIVSHGIGGEGAAQKPAGWGGPVHPSTGWMLFSSPPSCDPDQFKEVSEGVYFSGTLSVLQEISRHPPEQLRFFLGCAGWAAGQLEWELAQGAWIIAPVTVDAIFEVPGDELWHHVMRSIGVDPSRLIATAGIH
jgi:putative transcriptional regulator